MAVRKTKAARLWMSAGRVETHAPVLAGRVKKKVSTKEKSFSKFVFESIERGRKALLEDEGFSPTGAPDLVGAWAWFHREIYGIEPVELHSEWPAAVAAAKRVLVEYLHGDFDIALDFLRWNAARARSSKGESRMKWRFVFNGSAVTDWKVSERKRAG
jgi:hypothetical protein